MRSPGAARRRDRSRADRRRFPELRIDVIGSTSLHGRAIDRRRASVRGAAARGGRAQLARRGRIIGDEVEALYTNGRAVAAARANTSTSRSASCPHSSIARASQAPSRSANGAPMPKLYELAHCRAGDKGNTSTLSVIAYRAEDFPLLVRNGHGRAVAPASARHRPRRIRRYELPQLRALQFVCEDALAGGVTTSLALDAHGKSLSSALLEIEIEG
jgi:hypothetical protein